ncbi:MAG: aspartate--tRNA(Asn) ligase, partial [Candidatus Aenigmarchaeota archaeon]|nr:aspartate--tRNA(Asn) ligase [Candidatus Aenigmarchaeota archaeon]
MIRTHYFSEIDASCDGKEVTIAGWARNIRDSGKITFLFVADRTGETQIIAKLGEADEKTRSVIKTLDREDVIAVRGIVRINDKAPGGKEIVPTAVTVLNRAEKPLPMETDPNITSSLDTRLNYRFLDLRNPKTRAIFRVKDVIH